MEAWVQGMFLGALSIMGKSERSARSGQKGSGHAGDLLVGSAESSGLPAPPRQLEQPQAVRGGQPGTDVMGAKSACKGGRTQSRFLQDSTNSRPFPSALPSGDFGAVDRALQTPQALLLYRKKAVRV